jgi:predicted ATPase with chaperone activity
MNCHPGNRRERNSRESWSHRDYGSTYVSTETSGRKICEGVVLVVAWTLADLAGRDSPSRDDVTTELSFRQAAGA